jgi:branched-chain amino acid transport system substrate-binding protein
MRNLGKFWLAFLALTALLLVLAVACEEEKQETLIATPAENPTPTWVVIDFDDKITLGSHFAQSGTYGAAFAPVLAGMRAYFNYVNEEEGGVCGRQIDFRAVDDQYDPAQAVGVVRKLVEDDGVFAIVGGLGTDTHSAVWDYLNEEGIPDLWIMSGAHKFAAEPEEYHWSVPILPDYYVEGTIFGKYISENMPGKKVGVLYQDDDFGRDELAGVKNGLDPSKNELVSEQGYESTALDIRPQITNLKNDGAEVVVGACIPGHCFQALKAAYQWDWDAQFFLPYHIRDYVPFVFTGEEVQWIDGAMTAHIRKMYDWTDDPAIAEHHRIMDEYGDLPPSSLTIFGQLAGELTVAALRATCDNLTREGLMDAVHTIFQDYQSDLILPGITITLSEDDHLPIEQMRMMQVQVVDGRSQWEYVGEIISFAEEE